MRGSRIEITEKCDMGRRVVLVVQIGKVNKEIHSGYVSRSC